MARLLTVLVLMTSCLVACSTLVPRPQVATPLRGDSGLEALCGGDPLPSWESCRVQGEQAYEERTRIGITVTEIRVEVGAFRSTSQGECRDSIWMVEYATGPADRLETMVCGPQIR